MTQDISKARDIWVASIAAVVSLTLLAIGLTLAGVDISRVMIWLVIAYVLISSFVGAYVYMNTKRH